MFKSIIASTKTIGTLTAKATVASAKGVKVVGLATGKGTKVATLATGRAFKAAGHYVAEEYRSNKPVETFTYDQKVVDEAIREVLETKLAQAKETTVTEPEVIKVDEVIEAKTTAKRAQRVAKSKATTAKATV